MASNTLASIAERRVRIFEAVEGAQLNRTLARGYESVGADAQEVRELTRAIYLQNEAIILMLQGIGAGLSIHTAWELPDE